ncbi:PAS domain S-box protein [Bacillus salipaludis]|uniref:histidine kinase n=1 Tax=Bacillus salipaludis TaxID=2547811 RepID=A0AA90ZAF7_9BACI|nr:PAS domain S-box protein [Bacillus salipaludis]MDQ6600761.1 PAS domain S-box protein [Bacillus salipaludis]
MIMNNLIALDQYTCPNVERQKLEHEWEKFVSGINATPSILPLMHDLWQRCLELGISPLQSKTSINLSEEEIKEYVATDPLFRTLKPVLTKLKDMYMDSGHLITFCNPSGDIVSLDGDLSLMLKAEDMNFVTGSSWAENSIGTNTIGTAISTGSPIQVFAGEHFCQEVQNWTCSAAPIRDPATQKILGVIELTGLWTVNHPYFLLVVISAAQDVNGMLHKQLKWERFKLYEYYQSKDISWQSKSCLAVLDRGGKVFKASSLLYEKGLIDSNYYLVSTPSLSLTLASRQYWEYEHRNGIWRFQLTPIIYGGMLIGSVVHVIPPTITSIGSKSSLPAVIDGRLPSLTSKHRLNRRAIIRKLDDKKLDVEKKSMKLPDFYKSLFNHNPDGIFSCDLQANLLDVNPALERMIGYTLKELQLTSPPSLILPGYQETGMKNIEKTIKGKPQDYDVAIKHKNGYRIDIKVKNFPQEDLQWTRQQLDLFLKNTVDSIIIFDLKHHVIKVNKAFEEVFGWSEQEIIGRKKPTIPHFLVDKYTEILQKIVNNRHVMSLETIRQRKDGSLIDVSIFVSPIVNAKGNVTAFASILRDISDRKRIEEPLKESEMKYRILFEQTPDAVFLVELNGDRTPSRLIEINPVVCERLGRSREEILSMPITDIISQDSKMYRTFIKKTKEGKHSFTLQDEIVISGKKMNVERNIQVFKFWGKEVVLITSRDITERLKTEELLRKSEKLAVVGHLDTAIAHEVNNPLTVIKGFIQLLKSTENENNQHYIDVVLSEINRIEGITNEFMAAAKPQAVKVCPNNMYLLIEQVTHLFQTQAKLNNVQIRTEFESGIPLIPFERNQLKQVMINILKNAIASMPLGGEVLIQVKKSDDHHVCISIIDRGCGIPKERIPYLGEPFYCIKEEGIGLGLMICYKIIEAHGGEISIESEVGKGTKVDVILLI